MAQFSAERRSAPHAVDRSIYHILHVYDAAYIGLHVFVISGYKDTHLCMEGEGFKVQGSGVGR